MIVNDVDSPRQRRRRFRWRRRWRWSAAILVLAVLAGIYGTGLVRFADGIPVGVADTDTVTDAIVVLTGGSQRLTTGFRLLAEGRAARLFVSGVRPDVELAELARQSPQNVSEMACCVVLGHAAVDTIGNARETAEWVRSQDIRSIRLVTANYHMRRSLLEFRRAMPGIPIVPHPVFPPAFSDGNWWRHPATASQLIGEYHKYVGALLRHLIADLAMDHDA